MRRGYLDGLGSRARRGVADRAANRARGRIATQRVMGSPGMAHLCRMNCCCTVVNTDGCDRQQHESISEALGSSTSVV